jgi:hypothetical protein
MKYPARVEYATESPARNTVVVGGRPAGRIAPIVRASVTGPRAGCPRCPPASPPSPPDAGGPLPLPLALSLTGLPVVVRARSANPGGRTGNAATRAPTTAAPVASVRARRVRGIRSRKRNGASIAAYDTAAAASVAARRAPSSGLPASPTRSVVSRRNRGQWYR